MSDKKHENYEILNLIGYGLAKFDMDFVNLFRSSRLSVKPPRFAGGFDKLKFEL